jgi:hypothetical protein
MQQNFLSPIGFRFTIKRLPNVSFYVQGATIPGLSMSPTQVQTPFKTLSLVGDKLQREPFSVTVRLDEYMESYNEIFDWMVKATKSDSYDQYRQLANSDDGVYSDASLIILDSRGNPSLEVHFKDVFPISIGSVTFDTTQTDVNYVTSEISFEHNGHTVTRIKN